MARILIVDDDEADRIVLSTILERADHETFLAQDGEEALREYGGQAIEVVVTDLQMPKVHGLEFITVLRDLSPRIERRVEDLSPGRSRRTHGTLRSIGGGTGGRACPPHSFRLETYRPCW